MDFYILIYIDRLKISLNRFSYVSPSMLCTFILVIKVCLTNMYHNLEYSRIKNCLRCNIGPIQMSQQA